MALELADIFRQYGPAYRQKYANRLLPSHRRAMRAIEQCRTPALGGQVYSCPQCNQTQYSYHSCRNRHCPKCKNDKAQEWLEKSLTSCSPSPCPPPCAHSPAVTRRLSMTCSFVLRQLQRNFWPRIPVLSGDNSA